MATDPFLESLFPNLATDDYRVTSPRTRAYNCIAWAAGDLEQWWEPVHVRGYYWPPDAEFTYSLNAYIQAYEAQGYVTCQEDSLEEDYEKVAIYVDADGMPTHAARQLATGAWTSKLGMLEDIEHSALTALEGEHYGAASTLLKRLRVGT